MVDPLPQGTRVADRFEIGPVLGRGGFSVVYDVADLRRGDRAVLKEFAPPSASRRTDGTIELGPAASTLRRAFLTEAQTVGRLSLPGVLPVRLAFSAHGTACVVTDAVPGAKTLDAILREQGPLDADGALDLAYQLMETLEAVHAQGLLHRDLKPSNVLVGRDGRAYLLDFGAARAWTADATEAHTVVFTPGYAPPEQRTTTARRGPATDVYGLCATLYAALTGSAPADAAARAAGEPLAPLRELRPDLDQGVADAVEAGLALRTAERPASMAELRGLLDEGPGGEALDTLASLDALLVRSQRFAFDRRACPACGGILDEARPLARHACPVCRRGRVRARRLDERACPACRHGALRRARSGVLTCDECGALYVPRENGRLAEARSGEEHLPPEWARIAAGLDPDAGDAVCDACDAEFSLAGERLTLLRASEDPHGFASAYAGRPLPLDRIRWLAVGKRSPHAGLVCDRCDTEFDHTGRLLTLVGSSNRRLERLAGDTRSLDSWHRISEGLPEAGRQADLEERIARVLAAAYRRGEVGFGDLVWRGHGEYQGRPTAVSVRPEAFRIGRGLRVRNVRTAELRDLRAEGDWILAEGADGGFELRVEPVELVAHLRSGGRTVLLTAADLAARLAWDGLGDRFRIE